MYSMFDMTKGRNFGGICFKFTFSMFRCQMFLLIKPVCYCSTVSNTLSCQTARCTDHMAIFMQIINTVCETISLFDDINKDDSLSGF